MSDFLKQHSLADHVAENRARGDFPLKPEPFYIKYSVELPVDDFYAITTFELHSACKRLYDIIAKASMASDIDYDVFLGCYITYGLETEHDTPEQHAYIIELIQDHIKTAKEWLEDNLDKA